MVVYGGRGRHGSGKAHSESLKQGRDLAETTDNKPPQTEKGAEIHPRPRRFPCPLPQEAAAAQDTADTTQRPCPGS